MALPEIITRKRDIDFGLRRIPCQHFTVRTNRGPNAPLELHHGSLRIRKAENFFPEVSSAGDTALSMVSV